MDQYQRRFPDLEQRAAAAGLEVRFADLPLTRLHYVTGGDGPPLVIVPATYSAISDYLGLARFMAQRFRVYFFELPGHGLSRPFEAPFSPEQVARTVGDLLDAEGHERASIMGFSFGGILALTALDHLRDRVDSAILLSPCATHRALKHGAARLAALRAVARATRPATVQRLLASALHRRASAAAFGWFVRKVGRMEGATNLVRYARNMPRASLDALTYQLDEILTYDVRDATRPLSQPLYFGMSVNDPLLDFDVTLEALRAVFGDITLVRWDFPWHQPPEPMTFEWLNANFLDLLAIASGEDVPGDSRVERSAQRTT